MDRAYNYNTIYFPPLIINPSSVRFFRLPQQNIKKREEEREREKKENKMDMGMGQNDFDRLLFFEHARKQAEITYAQNPQDADVSPRLSFSFSFSFCLCFDRFSDRI